MKKALVIILALASNAAFGQTVTGIRQLNNNAVEVICKDAGRITIDFYGDNVFRMFQDNNGGEVRDPEAKPEADILVVDPRRPVGKLTIDALTVSTDKVKISFANDLFQIENLQTGKTVVRQTRPIDYKRSKYTLYLSENPDEYYYGGGVQNGRFSHRGEKIEIVNTNSWTDGGVASPAPFYWSTGGYAVMCYTFKPGLYDFGYTEKGQVALSHETSWLDVFFMVDDGATALLRDYYQLTGNPVLLPKFGFYEGHLNAYNRDYWKEADSTATRSILFEDGKKYVESQKDNGGIKESLNGEKDNYQFSARGVVDRYAAHDMPLGWVLPNDGYGAGYGQEETLDGNVANLKSFGDYARSKGVEIGLWTQSNLHPVEGVSALLQRDIVKEVRDAGVRVLKTDVAWVGDGYSFGLNGISDVAQIMPYYGNEARPFIISLDGWAGTHRYAAVWTGDQTGGKWEYIRFHIPTYIGSGLSGLGNITSDMDGIFGGSESDVNIRDFEWKTFTPMQLNMDGWGYNPKYPHALGEPAASINRSYLKWKSMLLPYTYSCSYQAVTDKPLIRPMFLESDDEYNFGTGTRYQYMYGPWFLIAPVYQATAEDKDGNDIRDGIYLPEGEWIDWFSGDVYEGGRIINNFDAPIWKLPVFVKPGAIIPMCLPNNNPSQIVSDRIIVEVYPSTEATSFDLYDDDGKTIAYKSGAYTMTRMTQSLSDKGRLTVSVEPRRGSYEGMPSEIAYTFVVNSTSCPKKVTLGKTALKKVSSEEEFDSQDNVWFYNEAPQLNRFATPDSAFASVKIVKNPQVWIKTSASDKSTTIVVDGCSYERSASLVSHHGTLTAPAGFAVKDEDNSPYSLTPSWCKQENADYYEIEYDGMTYSTIRDNHLTFADLKPETSYSFKVRAANADGFSQWASLTATTKDNPLEFALSGLTAKTDGVPEPDHEASRLFDFQTGGDMWYDYKKPGEDKYVLTIDLHCTAAIDSLQYLPRVGGGNGTILEGSIAVSSDDRDYQDRGSFTWEGNDATKTVVLNDRPEIRYIRITITKSKGTYVAGREIFVYRSPDSKVMIPGDINQDGKIDDADLTSYLNYTGLKAGDSDFEGYVSKGDLNGNGLIDAYDISEVATKLDGGIHIDGKAVCGAVTLTADKAQYEAGDEIVISVKGAGLESVNALSLILPYSEADMRFEKIEPAAVSGMANLTNDRLHTDGTKVLYPTFVNVGDKDTVSGDADLFTIRFKALRNLALPSLTAKGLLVDKFLDVVEM